MSFLTLMGVAILTVGGYCFGRVVGGTERLRFEKFYYRIVCLYDVRRGLLNVIGNIIPSVGVYHLE